MRQKPRKSIDDYRAGRKAALFVCGLSGCSGLFGLSRVLG
jgi:hypothetical protein